MLRLALALLWPACLATQSRLFDVFASQSAEELCHDAVLCVSNVTVNDTAFSVQEALLQGNFDFTGFSGRGSVAALGETNVTDAVAPAERCLPVTRACMSTATEALPASVTSNHSLGLQLRMGSLPVAVTLTAAQVELGLRPTFALIARTENGTSFAELSSLDRVNFTGTLGTLTVQVQVHLALLLVDVSPCLALDHPSVQSASAGTVIGMFTVTCTDTSETRAAACRSGLFVALSSLDSGTPAIACDFNADSVLQALPNPCGSANTLEIVDTQQMLIRRRFIERCACANNMAGRLCRCPLADSVETQQQIQGDPRVNTSVFVSDTSLVGGLSFRSAGAQYACTANASLTQVFDCPTNTWLPSDLTPACPCDCVTAGTLSSVCNSTGHCQCSDIAFGDRCQYRRCDTPSFLTKDPRHGMTPSMENATFLTVPCARNSPVSVTASCPLTPLLAFAGAPNVSFGGLQPVAGAPAWIDVDRAQGRCTCNCDDSGAFDNNCNDTMGACRCRAGFVGLACDIPQCDPLNTTSCGTDGTCDASSRVCRCDRAGFRFPFCGADPSESRVECLDGFYKTTVPPDSNTTCAPCECRQSTSTSLICAVSGGQCPCVAGFTGRQCNVELTGCPTVNMAPCNNAGTCVTLPNNVASLVNDTQQQTGVFVCDCTGGRRGPDCTVSPSDCFGRSLGDSCSTDDQEQGGVCLGLQVCALAPRDALVSMTVTFNTDLGGISGVSVDVLLQQVALILASSVGGTWLHIRETTDEFLADNEAVAAVNSAASADASSGVFTLLMSFLVVPTSDTTAQALVDDLERQRNDASSSLRTQLSVRQWSILQTNEEQIVPRTSNPLAPDPRHDDGVPVAIYVGCTLLLLWIFCCIAVVLWLHFADFDKIATQVAESDRERRRQLRAQAANESREES
ncbi:MAG: hypothetical protein MHM6MM_003143 [Cercozoa sp. M6MM]